MTSRGRAMAFTALIFALAQFSSSATAEPTVIVQSKFDLGTAPVVALCPKTIETGNYEIVPASGGDAIPASVYRDDGRAWIAFTLNGLKAGDKLVGALRPVKDASSLPRFTVENKGKSDVEIARDGKLITTYHAAGVNKPYFYPLFGVGQLAMTRAYPMQRDVPGETKDHPHQRSMWLTYGDVNGYEFWGSDPLNKDTPKTGKIEEVARSTSSGLTSVAILRTENEWSGLQDNVKVCRDRRLVKIFETGDQRIIDFDAEFEAPYGDVKFGDTKEGAFGVRVASSMDVDRKLGGKIVNAEGIADKDAWGKKSPWVDYTGPVQDQTVGVAILNHPASFRYPTAWHVRTYGLFAANPFGLKEFGLDPSQVHTMKKGETLRLSYRVILHKGDAQAAKIAQAYQAYANPPSVEIQTD